MVVSFVAILVVVLLALAFAIGMIARGWLLRMDDIVLHGIDVPRARDVVAMYVENVHDTRFGFPTGVFRIDERRSSPSRLVAREVNFGGGAGFRIVRFGIMIPVAFVAAAAEEGCLVGMLAFFAGCMFVGFFIVPIFCIAVIEFVLRLLMRSEVVTELEPVAGDHDACRVRLTLRGLSAFGVRRQLRDGLARPVLPVAYGGSAIENAPESWTDDRLNVVYAGGIAVAVLIAALVVALTPSLRGGGSSSTSYGYDTSSSSSGYADSGGSYSSSGSSSGGGSSASSSDESSSPDDTSSGGASSGSSGGSSSSDGAAGTSGAPDASGGGGAGQAAGADARLTVNAASGGAFSIHPPSGWSRDGDGEQHDGYVESSWFDPGAPKAVFLIDDTPGFAHSARYGAQQVRKLYWHGRVSDYAELDFSSTSLDGRPAWRWEFETKGLHKVDTFVVACGTGYAVLGEAPAGRWDAYADTLAAATDTLRPRCDGSSGDSSPDSAAADGSSSGDSSSGDGSSAGSGSSSGGGATLGPEQVLRAHFAHLGAGEYAAAFALMSPSYRRAQPGWLANRATADPGVDVIDVGPTRFAGRDAWVDVTFYARDRVDVKGSDTKCRRFEGTAHLRRFGAVWRYDPPDNDYAEAVVHRANANCP